MDITNIFENETAVHALLHKDNQAVQQRASDANRTSPYDPKKIYISHFNWSVDTIRQMLQRKMISLLPNFQRNSVWDNTKKSSLIESILLEIPIPAIYLAKDEKGGYHVVDGLQRLTTLKEFFNNEFKLTHLEYFTGENNTDNLEGLYYKTEDNKNGISTLKNGQYEFKIFSTHFDVHVIAPTTPRQIQLDIFKRLNNN